MRKAIKVFYWSPRIICILAILFVSLFAADAFATGITIWQQEREVARNRQHNHTADRCWIVYVEKNLETN